MIEVPIIIRMDSGFFDQKIFEMYEWLRVGYICGGKMYEEDIGSPVIPVGSYASTVRRRLIDITGKIVSHAGEIILKVSKAGFEGLRLPELFRRCIRLFFCPRFKPES